MYRDLGQAPKKSLGQHFLHDAGICRRIVNLLTPVAGDQILEIGPGPGALTGELLQAPHAKLLLIEKDIYWAEERAKSGGAEVLRMDALKFDWACLGGSGEWKLIGNLPYNVASPLIWDILDQCACWQQAVFMVQKEAGQRLAASPGSKAYGALSVWAQCHARVKLEFCIGPGAFRPPPKVDSAVMLFEPLPERRKAPERLGPLLKICFQQRRKQLGSILRGMPQLLAGLAELGIAARARPEEVTAREFWQLAELWGKAETGR